MSEVLASPAIVHRASRSNRAGALIGLVAALVFGLFPSSAQAEEAPGELGLADDPSHPHAEDHVLVRFNTSDGSLRTLGSEVDGLGRGWYEVPVPAGWEPVDWAVHLTSRPGVEVAELDPLFEPLVNVPLTSNDPLYTAGSGNPSAQWHLHAANVAASWQTTVGNGVRVAVIDTGVTEGSDGFCEPLAAPYNAVTGVPGEEAAADTDFADGHGSHVAGSIAQCTGNGTGGAGMAPGAQIMPVQVFSGDSAQASHVAQGIDWARANGATVINLSIGCIGLCPETSFLNSAIEQAAAAGVLMVAAAGNHGGAVLYPASHPAVMAVGSTVISGSVPLYSARGSGLDLVAPGGDSSAGIWQETLGSFRELSGTSMAAAHVSGAAALLRSRFPSASTVQIGNALNCSATDIGDPGWDPVSGHGRLDTQAAVQQLEIMVQAGAWSCGQSTSASYGAIQSSTGIWRLFHGPAQVTSFYYGNPGDFGFMGDWDCDGIDTPGLYRRSDGYVYLRNSNTQGIADVSFFFGNPGDLPLAGDFDGDGCDTVSIYRPSEGKFYVINHLGSSDAGLGAAEYSYYFGNPGDAPFMGDWDGDGIDTPGLRRDSNGFVYIRHTNTQGVGEVEYFYGDSGDVVFTGDWDNDRDDTLGLYRPSNGTVYLRNTNTTGIADFSFVVGTGMQAVAGKF